MTSGKSPQKSSNIFKRRCIGCFKSFEKGSMMKITKVHDSGDVVVNPSGKEFGRSVYICYSEECLNKALKKGKINKFLKSPIDENTLEKIKTVLKSLIVLQIE